MILIISSIPLPNQALVTHHRHNVLPPPSTLPHLITNNHRPLHLSNNNPLLGLLQTLLFLAL